MSSSVQTYLAWHEWLIVIIVLLLAFYILFLLPQLNRLKREKMRAYEWLRQIASSSDDDSAEREFEENPMIDVPLLHENGDISQSPISVAEAEYPSHEAPSDVFSSHRLEAMEREITQLHMEIEQLRTEVGVLREAARQETTKNTNKFTPQKVSPYYSEAMHMALQGKGAVSISKQCGISRAEADLVVSMAKKGRQ